MPTPQFSFSSTSLAADKFTVVNFSGREAIADTWQFDITVRVADADAGSLDTILTEVVTFTMEHDGDSKAYQGMVAELRDRGGLTSTGYVFKHLRVVPPVWAETKTRKNQIYASGQTVDQIVDLEIAEIQTESAALIRKDAFSTTYPGRPFTCQYKESNFNFISRLMEHYGIYYYFEYDAVAGMTMVITDDNQYPALSGIVTVLSNNTLNVVTPAPSGDAFFENLHSLDLSQQYVPREVVVQQFDPSQPSRMLLAIAGTSSRQSIFLDAENPVSQADADILAQVRLDELRGREYVWNGTSGVCLLTPGYQFNAVSRRLLISEVLHSGENLDTSVAPTGVNPSYSNTFECLDADLQYRPVRNAPLPVVATMETGRVYAEQADPTQAEIDEHGRYRVEFNFLPDAATTSSSSSDADKAKTSHWLRMAQPAAGTEDGMFIPLKPEVEVTIAFIGGNPDNPVITGALNNAAFPSRVNSHNSNVAILATEGLLALNSLGGSYKSVKATDATVPLSDPNHSIKLIGLPDPYVYPPTNNGPDQTFDAEPGRATELTEAQEFSGDYHIYRRYGDLYTKTFGNVVLAQYGNTYDYSSNWTYGYGNGYGETHLEYDSVVNRKQPDDLLDIGGADWSSLVWPNGPDKDGTEVLSAAHFTLPGDTHWANGNVWVSKTYGANLAGSPSTKPNGGLSYSYTEGDSISVSVNQSTLNITKGSGQTVIDAAYRGNGSLKSWTRAAPSGSSYVTENRKYNSAGTKTYESSSTYTGVSGTNDYSTTDTEKKYTVGGDNYYDSTTVFETTTGSTTNTTTVKDYLTKSIASFSTSAVRGGGNHAASMSMDWTNKASASFTFSSSASFSVSLSASVSIAFEMSASASIKGNYSATAELDLSTGVSFKAAPFKSAELKVEAGKITTNIPFFEARFETTLAKQKMTDMHSTLNTLQTYLNKVQSGAIGIESTNAKIVSGMLTLMA